MPLDQALETRVRELLQAGDPEGAAAALVRGYGGEIYGFLRGTLRELEDADDAFATWSEGVWRDLPSMRGDASFRTWSYAVARHAAYALRRGDSRRRKRIVGGGDTAAERVAWEVRSKTAAFRRTDVKDRVRALREQLSDGERELLTLRVDRELEWGDVAAILDEDAATLRKRFERIKDKLRVLAERDGLLPPRD